MRVVAASRTSAVIAGMPPRGPPGLLLLGDLAGGLGPRRYGGRQLPAIARAGSSWSPRVLDERGRPGFGGPALSQGSGAASFSTESTTRRPGEEGKEAPTFAFAFDIDGVLLHVAKPIPGAAESLRYLQEHGIPFILLTNGGGKSELERVRDLSGKLGVPLTTDNFVQSHTPFRQLVDGVQGGREPLRDKTVLVTGSDADKARAIAEGYGFRSVITPADILAACPGIFPFDPLLESHYASTARALPKPLFRPGMRDPDAEALRVDAIFVFNDPRDWALDIQLIADLLLSRRGILGTYSALNGASPSSWQADGQPELFFSNADLLWSTGYRLPRFGQGAFQAALAGVWSRCTGGTAELRRTAIGKPYAATYRYAERVLTAHRLSMLQQHHPKQEQLQGKDQARDAAPLRSVYMIGDNPESDIAGANAFRSAHGTDWCSVLVRTGVWSPEHGHRGGGRGRGRGDTAIPDGVHRPRVIVDDVKAAVRWALQREGWEGEF